MRPSKTRKPEAPPKKKKGPASQTGQRVAMFHVEHPRSAVILAAAILAVSLCVGCSNLVEEHIRAVDGEITFDRVAGRRMATGGFTLNKDSLVMKPN